MKKKSIVVRNERKKDDSARLAELFLSVSVLFSRWAASKLTHPKMSLQKARLIAMIQESGTQPMGRMSEALGIPKANMTILVDQLEGDGYLKRKRREGNRKTVFLEMTEKGLDLLDGEGTDYLKEVGTIFEGFSKKEILTIETYFNRLMDNFVAQRLIDRAPQENSSTAGEA